MRWIHEEAPSTLDRRIFDSEWEAQEWADSLSDDFFPLHDVGYATPDVKVFRWLCKLLPQWQTYEEFPTTIYTAIEIVDGRPCYKIT